MATTHATTGRRPSFHAPRAWLARLAVHPDWLASLTLLFLVALLWVPFGLNVGFVSDEWHFFGEVEQGGYIPVPLRPFVSVIWRVGNLFSPDSFAGFNFVLALLLWAKAILVLAILKRLSVPLWIAFSTAALTIALPADTGIFWLGAISLHLVLVFLLTAGWALMRYWTHRRLTSMLIMLLTLSLAAGIYEVTFIFSAVAPILLIILNRGLSWRFVRVAVLWYAVPLAFGLRYLYILFTQPSSAAYQTGLLELSSPVSEIVYSAGIALRRHFLDGWLVTDSELVPGFVALGLLAAIVVFLVFQQLMKGLDSAQTSASDRAYSLGLITGLMILALGLLPYLATSLRTETVRTYYYSSIGAALAITAALGWTFVTRLRRPVLYASAVALLVGLGMTSLVHQHARWAGYSNAQQRMSAALVQALGKPMPGTTIVMLDESPQRTVQGVFAASWYLTNILNILYRDYSLRAVFCNADAQEPWGSMVEACSFDREALTFTLRGAPMHMAGYDSVVLVRYLADDHYVIEPDLARLRVLTDAYDPYHLIDPSAPPPERLRTLFGIEAGA